MAKLILLSLLLGGVSRFAFAPYGYWPLHLMIGAGLLLIAIRVPSVRKNVMIGWSYGLGYFVSGIYWVYISMHDIGGMSFGIAGGAVLVMGAVLGMFPALALGGMVELQRRWRASVPITFVFIFPALWVLSEWVRGWVFTGAPWLSSGYATIDSPLVGFAPVLGVYGVGWISACLSGCLACLMYSLCKKNVRQSVIAVGVVGIVFGVGAGLKKIEWTHPSGSPVSVRLLQGNVPQTMKFESDTVASSVSWYDQTIRAARADLIVTPETAIPVFPNQLPQTYWQELVQFSQQTDSRLLVGIPMNDTGARYTNSVIGIAPNQYYRYDKHHLLPFGEFIPFGFRWFVDLMNIPLGDFTRGGLVQPAFQVRDQWVMPNICYEDLFGGEIAMQLTQQHPAATILLNMSNMGWFGNSIALPQHLQISQMRALEMGRPMLRATNTGVTAVIDAHGRVMQQLPVHMHGVLSASVQGYQGWTPYIRFGNGMIVCIALLMCWIAWRMGNSNRE